MTSALVVWLGATLGFFVSSYIGAPLPGALLLHIPTAPLEAAKAGISFLLVSLVLRRHQPVKLIFWLAVGVGVLAVILSGLTREVLRAFDYVGVVELGALVFGGAVIASVGTPFDGDHRFDGSRTRRTLTVLMLSSVLVAPLVVLLPLGLFVYVVEHHDRPLSLLFGLILHSVNFLALISTLVLVAKFADTGDEGLRSAAAKWWAGAALGAMMTLVGWCAWMIELLGDGLGRPFHLLEANIFGTAPLSLYLFLRWRLNRRSNQLDT
jgi:hypothetical protein